MQERKKDKDFIVSIFYCRIKLHLNIYNKYVLQQWAAEEQESLIKAQKKLAPRRQHNIAMFFGLPDKSDEIKLRLCCKMPNLRACELLISKYFIC